MPNKHHKEIYEKKLYLKNCKDKNVEIKIKRSISGKKSYNDYIMKKNKEENYK